MNLNERMHYTNAFRQHLSIDAAGHVQEMQLHDGILCKIEDLLQRLPPLARLGAHGPVHEALLVAVRHLPPLAHLGVRRHARHVSLEIATDILHGSKQQAVLVVVPYGICFSKVSAK